MLTALEYELDSRRVEAAQLQRMTDAINSAIPDFKSAMGSECDHAECALRELIEHRKALLGLTLDIHEYCRMALRGEWDRGDEGFEDILSDIEKVIERVTK